MIVIVEAQENLRVALTENEKLRESNDIQNKLWKIWLNEDKNIEIEKAENGEPTTVNVDDNEEEDKEDDVELK